LCSFLRSLRKQELCEYAESLSLLPVSACHPGAYIAQTAIVAVGAIINAGSVIQPFASIGTGVMIHANAVVEHNCVLDDYVNLAPDVCLAGWISVGDGTKINTGASVIPQVRIGKYAAISAGANVIENIPDRALVASVPGIIKYISE
jgi:UDP-3-O-[3-hydroxymyristoyl] glucosamine N-acyltransferase